MEDILSFEVRHKYQTSKGKLVTSSGRVLQELGKTYPEAASLFNRCFESSSSNGGDREDYVQLRSDSLAERKVLWIRVALVEGNLQGIVEQLLKKPRWDEVAKCLKYIALLCPIRLMLCMENGRWNQTLWAWLEWKWQFRLNFWDTNLGLKYLLCRVSCHTISLFLEPTARAIIILI